MKFKVRGDLDHVVKSVEFDRTEVPTLNLNEVKQQLERRFKIGNVGMRYTFSDGRQQPLYQDVHLTDALKDVQKSGAKFLALSLVNLSGGSSHSASHNTSYSSTPNYGAPSPSTSSTTPNRARTATSPSSSGSATMKACPTCSTQLTITAKFCSGCGSKC